MNSNEVVPNKILEDLKKNKWINYGRWKQPTISGTFWTHWHEAESAREIFPKVTELFRIIFLDGYHETMEKGDKVVRDMFIKLYETGTLEKLYNRVEQASKKAEEEHLALLEEKNLSDIDYLVELFRTYLEVIGSWGFLFRAGSFEEEIAKNSGLASSDNEILGKIRPYVRTTWLEQQTIEIKSFARQINKKHPSIKPNDVTYKFISSDAPLIESIKSHVKNFSWFGTHHWEGEGYTIEKCIDDIRGVLKKGEFGPSPKSTKSSSKSKDDVVWKIIASFAYWRTHCAEVTAKVVFESRKRLEKVAKGLGMTYAELLYLSNHEILEALKKNSKNIELPKNFSERKHGYGCIIDKGYEYIFTGKELTSTIDALVPKTNTNVSEVKGTIASKGGIVSGIARIMMAPSDFPRFREGDILIANETSPDFVPLMKKATAIVTDTGGVTSHAAIVSRELKKPCIIGTKIGTRVFKDGERVEVDTNNGVVKRLK